MRRYIVAQPSRFSHLTPSRQALVRLCQSINHGELREMTVRDREPVFIPAPIVVVDVKLNVDESPRPEIDLNDFELPEEVCRLLRRFDRMNDGKVAQLEVRSGVPRRVLFESTAREMLF
jgi:hypothetical protein